MPDDSPGFRLVGGDMADGAALGADAAVGGVNRPGAEQVGPRLDAVGPEAASGRVDGFEADGEGAHHAVGSVLLAGRRR